MAYGLKLWQTTAYIIVYVKSVFVYLYLTFFFIVKSKTLLMKVSYSSQYMINQVHINIRKYDKIIVHS